jgi:acetyl-CoA carboxylase biotin carboxyl carrier protein
LGPADSGRGGGGDLAQSASQRSEKKEGSLLAVEIEAQITGNVWKIEKQVGDAVEEEDVILIIESMKMEIPVEAPCSGRISEIRTTEGASVEEGDILVVLD